MSVVLVACGGSDEATKTASRGGVPPSTVAEATTVPPTTVGETTTSSARRTTPTTARRGSSGGGGSTGGPAAATALTPPAAGVYRYDTSGTSTFGTTAVPFPAVSTLTVDPPGGTRQRSVRQLRDAAGNGPQIEFLLDYRPDGIYVEQLKLTTTFSGISDVQDLRPAAPVLILATGAAPGARQEFSLSAGGTGAVARVVVEALRREAVAVGGRSVDTLVVRIVAALPPGDVTGRVELTTWMAPSVRLWVKERFVTDASAAGGLFTLKSSYDATLQRLP